MIPLPPIKKPEKENELIGGIKNALERGESPQEIKQSFLNSGYSLQEIEQALKPTEPPQTQPPQINPPQEPTLQQTQPQIQYQEQIPEPNQPPQPESTQPQTLQQQNQQPTPQRKKSNLFIIIAIIISIIVIIIAGIVGLYWNKIINLFV